MKQYDAGVYYEKQAEAYLVSRGMTPLASRFRAGDGEIDLILLDGPTVVFVEVKARPKGRAGAGLLAITPAKQKRIAHAAALFLLEREWTDRPVRFDCVELTQEGIRYVPNAFQTGMWW